MQEKREWGNSPMFEKFFGRRKRDERLLATLVSAAAKGQELSKLRTAMGTLGFELNGPTGIEKVGMAASEMAKYLANTTKADISRDSDAAFVAGLFAVAGANCFSYRCDVPFEQSATLALLKLDNRSVEAFADYHASIIASFNQMSQTGSDTIKAIGVTIGRWENQPSPEERARLVELFGICLDVASKQARK